MSSKDIHIGAIVEVSGYGGTAKVLNIEVDGVTPQGHEKLLCTVEFAHLSHAASPTAQGATTWWQGSAGKKSRQPHQFYAGRLTLVRHSDGTPANNGNGTTQAQTAAQTSFDKELSMATTLANLGHPERLIALCTKYGIELAGA